MSHCIYNLILNYDIYRIYFCCQYLVVELNFFLVLSFSTIKNVDKFLARYLPSLLPYSKDHSHQHVKSTLPLCTCLPNLVPITWWYISYYCTAERMYNNLLRRAVSHELYSTFFIKIHWVSSKFLNIQDCSILS